MRTTLECPQHPKMFTMPRQKFCNECGARLVEVPIITCQHCDVMVNENDKFCGGCGRPREEALTKS